MEPSQEIRKRLLHSRYFVERARTMQRELGDLGTAVSLTLMHDAAEMLMIAVVDHLQVPTSKKRDFLDFWKELKQAGHPEPPFLTAMDQLNALRVGLKHKGNLPRPETVRDLMPRVEDFCAEVTRTYVGLDYQTLDMADLVDFPDTRQGLKEAQSDFAKGDKTEAFVKLRLAFDGLMKKVYGGFPALQTNFRRPEVIDGTIRLLTEGILSLEQRLNLHLIGIDPVEHLMFTRATPNVAYSTTGKYQVQIWHDYRNVQLPEFTACYVFVVKSALAASALSKGLADEKQY